MGLNTERYEPAGVTDNTNSPFFSFFFSSSHNTVFSFLPGLDCAAALCAPTSAAHASPAVKIFIYQNIYNLLRIYFPVLKVYLSHI